MDTSENATPSYWSKLLWTTSHLLSLSIVNRFSRNQQRYGKHYEPAADREEVFRLADKISDLQRRFQWYAGELEAYYTNPEDTSSHPREELKLGMMVLQQQIDHQLSELHQQLLEFDTKELYESGLIPAVDEQRRFWDVDRPQSVAFSLDRTGYSATATFNQEVQGELDSLCRAFDEFQEKLKQLQR